MKYLVPDPERKIRRYHSVVSHILADDGETALCVVSMNKPGIYHAWPHVKEGDWKIADDATGGRVCSRCRKKKCKMEAVPASFKEKFDYRIACKRQRELEKLERWNASISKVI